MQVLPHFIRDKNGNKIPVVIVDEDTHANLEERVDNIVAVVPYFQQAAQILLFAKLNPNNYPNTIRGLKEADDDLIASNSYDGLTEGQKAVILRDVAANNLGIPL